jgi:hypothetical protein
MKMPYENAAAVIPKGPDHAPWLECMSQETHDL